MPSPKSLPKPTTTKPQAKPVNKVAAKRSKKSSANPLVAEQVALVWDAPGLMAGVDEAGRGPLAGPVVAAAVILDDLNPIKGLGDSKPRGPAPP